MEKRFGQYKREELFSVPNCMGYFRILLIPLFCVLYIRQQYVPAATVLLLSTVTDFLDGKVARHFHQVTEFGKLLDPVADKLTHAAVAFCLAFRYRLMLYLVILLVVKEGFMAVMGVLNMRHGQKLDGAMWFGKVCTASLFVVLLLLVFVPDIPPAWADALIIAELCIMTITLLCYIPVFYRMMKAWE